MKTRYLPILLLAALAVPVRAADSPALEEQYKNQIERLLPGMAAKEIPDREKPQQTLEKLCHEAGAPGKDAERAALSKAIMAFAGPETDKPARVWLLRKIEPLGREEVVEPLARLLHDEDREIADLARRALANNPTEKALAALRAELSEATKPAWKAAIINALAWRRDEKSVERFAKLAQKRNPLVATAAISALGQVASDEAVDALAELRKSAPAELKLAVADASLRAAELLRSGEKTKPASAIYTELLAEGQPEHIRIAALTGLAGIHSPDTLNTLLKYAVGSDAHLRIIAARCLVQLPAESQVTRQITETMRRAAPASRALLIEALGERGDPQALPAVMQFMEDQDKDVQLASYAAIGKLGSAATVRVLVVQGAEKKGEVREAIRDSLARLKGPGVNEAILEWLPKAQGPARIELITAVWGRRIVDAKPILLNMVKDGDEDTRVAVLTAMERIGNEADLPTLVEMLLAAKSEDGVKAAETAITSVCRRAGDPEKAAIPLSEAMVKADPAAQVTVIRMLAKMQGPAALAAVRDAAKSEDAKVKEATLAALAEWKPLAITAWQIAGPFREEGKTGTDLFDMAFAPETGDSANWKPLKNPGADGRFDLAKTAKGDNCCVYVKTTIQSERRQDVILAFGSDDGVKAWLNGKPIHANNVTRGLKCGEDQVKATLEEGANTLLLKITQGSGEFAFCAGLKAADGAPPAGVQFEAR